MRMQYMDKQEMPKRRYVKWEEVLEEFESRPENTIEIDLQKEGRTVYNSQQTIRKAIQRYGYRMYATVNSGKVYIIKE